MRDADELDQHLNHKMLFQLDPDLWEEEMKYDARRYLMEQGDEDEQVR